MCVSCNVDANYFHTAQCVYDYLVLEYPVLWLRDTSLIKGSTYSSRNLPSPEGNVLAIWNAPPGKGLEPALPVQRSHRRRAAPYRAWRLFSADRQNDAFTAFLRFAS